jgi:hypothetical protein
MGTMTGITVCLYTRSPCGEGRNGTKKEDLSLKKVVDEGGDKEGQENEVAQQVEDDEVNLPEKKPVSALNGEYASYTSYTSRIAVSRAEILLSSQNRIGSECE